MTTKSEVMERDYPKLIGMLLVVVSVLSIIVLFVLDVNVIFEPPLLLPVTNTIFTAIIPIIVAFFAARTYLKSGSLSVFLMGCGMLSFGISAALAGWLRPAQNGANINVTIYNTGALVGSLFHISGAVFSSFRRSPRWEFERGKLVVACAYCGVFAFIILFTFATFERIVPPFFIQGSGPTALRQIVLGLAIFFYLLSAIFFMDNYLKTKSDFFYWYSLGLAMLSLGLFAFYIQKGVGSPIGWAGRTTNYIGAVFTLVAILTAIRSGRSKGLDLEDVISSFFMEAEANFRSLVETATDAIISYDQGDRIILWNSAAERIFGYTKRDAIGLPFVGLFIPEEYATVIKELIGAPEPSTDSSHSRSTAEIEAKRKDGSLLPVEISAFAKKLPTGLVSTCIVRDITERKRAEDALRQERNFVSAVLDTAGALVVVLDRQGRITRFNRACEDVTGYSAAEVQDRVLWEFLIPPEELAGVKTAWEELTVGAFPNTHENHWMAKDGSRRLIAWSNSALISKAGDVQHIIGTGIDITERKQAEEELIRRTAQLETANKELESFSYSVSHDLRAPLRAIDGYARMLQKKHGDEFDEDSLRKFNVIRSSTQMMGQLIDDLLTLSRLGRKQMSVSEIDMEALIRDVWKEVQADTMDRNINLTVSRMPSVYGDRALIKQVYVNLFSNAVKFTKNQNPALIDVGGHVDENDSVYYVKDNGVGFDMTYYDKLFGVFQQLHKAEDFEGTGIGLATVQRVINRHGGRVWAEGKVDGGATFYFSLPSNHKGTEYVQQLYP